jgi:hypothetical protein
MALRHIYKENEIRKVVEFPYKSSRKGIDYKQLDPYYEWINKNRHTEWLGLFITRD